MKEVGTKKEVYNDKARRTKKGLTKNDLEVNAKGNVVQKKRGRASAPSAPSTRPAPSAPSASSTRAMNNFGKWHEHVKKFRASHPNLSYKEALQQAKTTYKKGGTTQPPRREPREEKQREQKTRDEPEEEKAGAKPDTPPLPKSKKPKGHFVDGKFYPYPTEKAPSRPKRKEPSESGIKGKVRDAKKKEPIQQLTRGETDPVKVKVSKQGEIKKKPTKRLPMRPVPSRPKKKLEPHIPDQPRESAFTTYHKNKNKTFEKGQVYEPFNYMLVKIGDRTGKKSVKVEIKNREDGTIKKATPRVGNFNDGDGEYIILTKKMNGEDSNIRLNASSYEKPPPATKKQKELLLTKGTPLPTDIIKYISGMVNDTGDLKFVKGKYYRHTDHPNPVMDKILFRYEGGGNFRDYISGIVYKAHLRTSESRSTARFTINLYEAGYTNEQNLYFQYQNFVMSLDSRDIDVVTKFDMRRKEDVEERLRKRQEPLEEKKGREEKDEEKAGGYTGFMVGATYGISTSDKLSNLTEQVRELENSINPYDPVVRSDIEMLVARIERLKGLGKVGIKIIKRIRTSGRSGSFMGRQSNELYQIQVLDSADVSSTPFNVPVDYDKDGNELLKILKFSPPVELSAEDEILEMPEDEEKKEEDEEEKKEEDEEEKKEEHEEEAGGKPDPIDEMNDIYQSEIIVHLRDENKLENSISTLEEGEKFIENITKSFDRLYDIYETLKDGGRKHDAYLVYNNARDAFLAVKEIVSKKQNEIKGIKKKRGRKRTYGGGLSRDEHHRNIISAGIVRY